MAVHPLRPATRRRLGRPLPHQQADRPRAHLAPKKLSTTDTKQLSYPVLDPVSQAYPEVQGRSPTCYSPVRHSSTRSKLQAFPFDLHVLSTPPAFVLSQDQTLHKKISAQKPKNQAVKSPNLTKRQTNQKPTPSQNTTTSILNKAGKSKNYYTKKNHNHPQPDGAKKGGSQTTKNDSRNLNAYQTNKLNYLQSRPKRPDPAHTTPTKHPA